MLSYAHGGRNSQSCPTLHEPERRFSPHSMLYAPRYRALVQMLLVDGSRPGTSAGRDCQGHGSSPWTGASPEATPKHGSADCNTACAPDRTEAGRARCLKEPVSVPRGHPGQWSPNSAARPQRGVPDRRHQCLVFGVALRQPGEAAEVGTRNKHHVNALEVRHLFDDSDPRRLARSSRPP